MPQIKKTQEKTFMVDDISKAIIAFKIASVSVPGKLYLVTIFRDGSMRCQEFSKSGQAQEEGCVANEMNKTCRHKKTAYLKLKAIGNYQWLVEAIEVFQKEKVKEKNEKRTN